MVGAALIAGLSSSIVALLIGSTFGTLGGWEPILAQVGTQLGSWILAIVLGIFFSLIYVYLGFSTFLPGISPVKGAVFGVLVWVILVIVGAFSIPVSQAVFSNTFPGIVLHIIWGASLAMIYQVYPKEGERMR